MTPRRWVIAGILAAAIFLLAGRALAAVWVDHQWYATMGAADVWRAKAAAWLAVRGTSGVLATLFLFANLYAVRHSVVSLVLPRRVGNIEIGEEVPGRYLVGGAALLALLLGALLTMRHEPWSAFALAKHGVQFGERDPYFDVDLGFYVAWLPFEAAVHLWVLITVLLTAAVVIFLYALTPSLRWERGTLYMSMYVQRHLVVLGALLLLLLAWSYRLDAYELLLGGSGPEGVFGYTDHRAALPAATWMSFLSVIAALLVLWFGWTGQLRVAIGAVGVLLLIGLLVGQGGPPLVRRMATLDPTTRERPYLATRAEYTRRAFAIERVLRGDSGIALPGLRERARAISVWDPSALARAVSRPTALPGRTGEVGWAAVGAELTATVPLRPPDEGEADAHWGAQKVLAGAADLRGEPIVLPSGLEGRDALDLPRVLVHPGAVGWMIVADSSERIMAPSLEEPGARLAHAWNLQNFRLLGADLPHPHPSLVLVRDVRDRVNALVPFFAQGHLAPMVALDSLFWTLELYSASSTYPLSDRVTVDGAEYSYLKHAATAIVNAHTGRVMLVADSTRDPIAERWIGTFPSMFRQWSEVPPALGRALPPTMDDAAAQAIVLARYGMRGEAVRGGEVPASTAADSALAGDQAPQLAVERGEPVASWSEVVLDASKHVAGVVLATGGRERATYWIPLPRQGPRWSTAVVDPLRRALDSTSAVPRDARTVRGRIRAVPVAGELAFVQPLYAWRPDGVPALARVAIVTSDGVVTGRTLADAVGAPAFVLSDTSRVLLPADFRARVAALYVAMQRALEQRDWVAFGRAYDSLGALVAPRP